MKPFTILIGGVLLILLLSVIAGLFLKPYIEACENFCKEEGLYFKTYSPSKCYCSDEDPEKYEFENPRRKK